MAQPHDTNVSKRSTLGAFYAENTKLINYRKYPSHSYLNDFMTTQTVATGVVHTVPADLRKSLLSNVKVCDAWNDLTPLARNEWICWVTYVKKEETRTQHIERLSEDLLKGKRRPCCWPGCPHRRPSAKKWFAKKL